LIENLCRDIETDLLERTRRQTSRYCSGLAARFNLSRSRRQADLALASTGAEGSGGAWQDFPRARQTLEQ